MGVEMTSGFDSSIINTVQLNDAWKLYFNNPTGALSGIISASVSFVPSMGWGRGRDREGRGEGMEIEGC